MTADTHTVVYYVFIKSHSGVCMVVFSGHFYSNFLDRLWEIIYFEFKVLCKDIKNALYTLKAY